METEIEAKWLEINVEQMRRKLQEIGAELAQPERMLARKPYDFPDRRLEKNGGWVRVRNEGDKITLSYKQQNDRTLHGTKEVTLVVDNFGMTCNFLEAIGLEPKSYQETKRESWKFGDTEIELDTWPWIPSFIEIEAPNEKRLCDVAEKLDLNISDAMHGSVEPVYQKYYDVSEEEVNNWPEITFSEVPEWLEAKRKVSND